MEKKVRKAVRSYLIRNNKVVVIKYKQGIVGFYDIPGGKIEDNETSEVASIREFKEETGITINKQHYIGNLIIEYPERIFDLDLFIVDDFSGDPLEFDENNSMWIDIDDLEKEDKIMASCRIVKKLKDSMNVKAECDENHKLLTLNIR